VFLDIVAQGNSFSTVAYGWDHDLELTQGYYLLRIARCGGC
jgi:hypothetical protein